MVWKDLVRYTVGVDVRVKHSRVISFVAANSDDNKQRDSASQPARLFLWLGKEVVRLGGLFPAVIIRGIAR